MGCGDLRMGIGADFTSANAACLLRKYRRWKMGDTGKPGDTHPGLCCMWAGSVTRLLAETGIWFTSPRCKGYQFGLFVELVVLSDRKSVLPARKGSGSDDADSRRRRWHPVGALMALSALCSYRPGDCQRYLRHEWVFDGLLAIPGLILVLATSLGLFLVQGAVWSVALLAIQYVGVFVLVSLQWPFPVALSTLMAGWIAAFILGFAIYSLQRRRPLLVQRPRKKEGQPGSHSPMAQRSQHASSACWQVSW